MAQIDDEYLLAHFGHDSQAKMAKHFGVSKSTINRHLKRLGLTGASGKKAKDKKSKVHIVAFNPEPEPSHVKPRMDEKTDIERLRDLREYLYAQIHECEPKDVARISKEYREVLAEIRKLSLIHI